MVKSRKLKTFVGSYRHRDRWLTFDIEATGFADAEAQLKAFAWAHVAGAGGKSRQFEVRYRHQERDRSFVIEAADMAEAKEHLNALCFARIDGELIMRGPMAALPVALPIAHLKHKFSGAGLSTHRLRS